MADNCIIKAAGIIQAGGLVSFPTETVYGLGADAFNPSAVAAVYAAKGRPSDNPLILHVASMPQVLSLIEPLPGCALALVRHFWPGPLTIIAQKKSSIPTWIGGHPNHSTQTIGIRMPSHPVAMDFLRVVGCPVVAPSANKSGRPSPTTLRHVHDDFLETGEIGFMLDGAGSEIGIESTVVDVTGEKPIILRHGAITEEMIGDVTGLGLDTTKNDTEPPRAPGMKYRHYAPKAPMTVCCGNPRHIAQYIATHCTDNLVGLLVSEAVQKLLPSGHTFAVKTLSNNPNEVARDLFANLRYFDDMAVTQIFAEGVPLTGLGMAIMDRMGKAAEGNIIHL